MPLHTPAKMRKIARNVKVSKPTRKFVNVMAKGVVAPSKSQGLKPRTGTPARNR